MKVFRVRKPKTKWKSEIGYVQRPEDKVRSDGPNLNASKPCCMPPLVLSELKMFNVLVCLVTEWEGVL